MARRQEGDSLLSQTRALLHRYELRARKRLGQHFLINGEVLQDILMTAQLQDTDIVVEVGPGLGILTSGLLKDAGQVIAIELDDNLAALLKKDLSAYCNIAVINRDILTIDPAEIIKEARIISPTMPAGDSYKLVSNLPYYITAPVLRHFLETTFKPDVMVVMVQKEVAQSIVAGPGDMSVLSVAVQFYGRPEIIRTVPAECFYPEPEVDSAILKITPHAVPPLPVTDERSFFEVVRGGFAAPRKQLPNSLATGMGIEKEEATSLLKKAEINPQRRAETLSLEEWARLWREFMQAGNDAESHGTG